MHDILAEVQQVAKITQEMARGTVRTKDVASWRNCRDAKVDQLRKEIRRLRNYADHKPTSSVAPQLYKRCYEYEVALDGALDNPKSWLRKAFTDETEGLEQYIRHSERTYGRFYWDQFETANEAIDDYQNYKEG